MENFMKGLFVGLIIGIIVGIITLQTISIDKQNLEIAIKTQECLRAGGTEYLYWNGTCQKVIQERKVETILITK